MSRAGDLLEPGRLLGGALVGALLRERLALAELAPGQQLGAFRIERELGRGGMGIVYLATRADGAYEQEVAIKWLPLGGPTTSTTAQFRRERQILAGLRHPHIARLLDGGCSDDGHLWFAMEHVGGLPADRHAAQAKLDWRARVRLLLPVIEAVQFAHAHLLVHRDIKPDNVLVDGDGRAMLVDFGIAALLHELDARAAYTDGYASPEQRAGAPPDIAADVWQIGRLLQAVLAAAAPGHAAPKRPRDLDAILACASHVEPARRYATAQALHADLQRLLAHRPVSARRPNPWHRLALLGQAHPWGTLGSALALLAFAATISGFMLRLTHQRNVAEHARATAEAVNAFVDEDLLPGADPLQAGSGDVSAAALAERALTRVEPRLHDAPEAAARVELSLGRTLANLGHFQSAGHAFDEAIGHLVALYGANDARVLQARFLREQQLLDPAHLTNAEPRLRALRADVLHQLGPRAELLLDIDSQLAHAANVRDDFSTCVTRYTALLPRLAHADDAVLRADAYMELSLCEARLGEDDMALAHARTSLTLITAAVGPQHPFTYESGLALETALVGLGRYDEAVGVLRQLVAAFEQRYGAGHPVTLTAIHDLGFALTCAGHPGEGARWLERAAQGREQTFGPHHPWYAMSESVLGMALIDTHQLDPAAAALARARDALGTRAENTPYVQAILLENEADLALAQAHAADAATRYTTALAAARKLYPATHPRLAVLQLGRGLALFDAGQTLTGKALLRDALQRLGTRPTCRADQVALARRRLGVAHH